ncbi:glucose-6-phosphate isomerase [Gemmobacter sp.]|uniref:glucose-6-phosphate isomerase n=1 Tax=Gemmobacter sp. TaxID=1898957 RepID=UPI002AFF531E|nr:glucose-6-phosphate isomerase [Gemmobacter sp.]
MTIEATWKALATHHAGVAGRSILSLFDDPGRAAAFSAELAYEDGAPASFLLDYSKTNLDVRGLALLMDLARAARVEARRDAMFAGRPINETEGRAVLHTMLRGAPDPALPAAWTTEVIDTLRRMVTFARAVRSGAFAGVGGAFTDVINIGIGGSDLGPVMATLALAPYHDGPRAHFISNVDGAQAADTLRGLNPATTLVIVASKTFTTIETMTNAATVRDWMQGAGVDAAAQMVAVSSAGDLAAEWGIPPERVFGFGDFIGGRYSVWGPVGLAVMLAVGPEDFGAFLDGAALMDRHFRQAPLDRNLPVLLAMVGVWHAQICGYATRAVLPYDQRLSRLPAYLQQLEMESNGKRVAMDGTDLPRSSGPVVWGEPGTNGQHAFYQMIHQGTRVIPCEFLIAAQGHEPALAQHHRLLIANCLAQSEALMRGRSLAEARALMAARGLTGAELERQARHRVFPGDRPSVTMAYRQLTPFALGMILALYEHRVFVEGVVLGINSFDQWGVELGKELALKLEPLLTPGADDSAKDGSTRLLLGHLRG